MKRGEIAHNVSRGAFFLGLEKGVQLLSTLAYSAMLARWLGPTKYGVFSAAFAIVDLATVLTGNFEVYLERYAAETHAHGRLAMLARAQRAALALKLGLGLAASIGVALLAAPLARHFESPELTTLLPLLTLFIATSGLAMVGRALLFGLQRFELVSAVSLVFNLGRTALVGFLWWDRQGLVALALGLSVLTAVQAGLMYAVGLVALAEARRDAPEDAGAARGPLFRPMLAYALPLLGARAAFMSGQNMGKLVLATTLDPTRLGYYAFAFQTVERFVELMHALPTSLLPSFTHLVARGERERLRDVFDQALRLVQLAACALAFLLFAFAPEITRIIGSPLFAPAVPLLRILALVPLVRTAQQPLTMLFQALHRPGAVLRLAILKISMEVAAYLLLLPALGAAGACWANFAGAAASYMGALWITGRLLPEHHAVRVGMALRNIAFIVPGLVLALMADQVLGPARAFPVRLLLLVPGVAGAFALGLVTRYDLEKLEQLPLRAAGPRWVRDQVVATSRRLADVFAAGRP